MAANGESAGIMRQVDHTEPAAVVKLVYRSRVGAKGLPRILSQ